MSASHLTATSSINNATRLIALVGNPNTGKTTLFNALTGFKRHVANYPGVTVELADGKIRDLSTSATLLDLPGTYSIAAISPDEQIVSNLLAGRTAGVRRPDVILAIVDASNLTRNLYLVSQLLEIGVPLVIALNMSDIAAARGIEINTALLAERLGGVPVIPVTATDEHTLKPLRAAIEKTISEAPIAGIRKLLPVISRRASAGESTGPGGTTELNPAEVRARYAWVNQTLEGVVTRPANRRFTPTNRIDAIVTHPIGGAVVLVVILATVFQALFSWSKPATDVIDWCFAQLADAVGGLLPDGVIHSFVTDGLIGGIGGVVVFLPQILILFLFIAVLEDCGYMARAAFMMDRLMRIVGLSGRAFIPILSGYACAIPAIMGTRSIADWRERAVTILIIPLMSCSARLPVYSLMIGAFVPPTHVLGGWVGVQGLVLMLMYAVGAIISIPVAWVLKKTAFAGAQPGFLLELPTYKWPRFSTIWQRMAFAGKSFLIRAGTVILFVNLVVWALTYFPRSESARARIESERSERQWTDAEFERELKGEYLRTSYLGQLGHAIEPAIRPLGWDWRIGVSVLASFPAREVIVSSLGTIFSVEDGEEDQRAMRDALATAKNENTGRPLFSLPVALSVMVFFALCAQCSSTLVIMGRELRSFWWPVASFVGMTVIAYFAAWGVYAAARGIMG